MDIDGAHGTPLHTASYYGNAGALKILLDHHADVMCKFHTFFIDNLDNLMQSRRFICLFSSVMLDLSLIFYQIYFHKY